MDINRDALLLYLRDLRDMEMAKYQIRKMIVQEEAGYQNTDAELQMTDFWEFHPKTEEKYSWSEEETDRAVAVIFMIIAIIIFAVSIPGIRYGASVSGIVHGTIFLFFFLLAAACVAVVIFCVVGIAMDISGESKYSKELEKTNAEIRAKNQELKNKVLQHNAEEQARQERNAQLRIENRQKWDERKRFLEDEVDRVDGLLKNAYGENILPKPYRSLAPLYYIYDYMSTSRESFEDTLMHEHLENGFQRILARLDTIVNNQAEEIFTLHRMEAQNTVIIAQNEAMLDELEQIDVSIRDSSRQINATLGDIRDNTYQTAQYAQQTSQYAQQASQYADIAATYSAVNAYFSWADYLKN